MAADHRLEGRELFAHPLAPAVMATVAERRYQAARTEEFFARAELDPTEFEGQFEGKADIVLRVFEAYIEDFEAKAAAAYANSSVWPDNLRMVGYEAVRWINRHPDATWFGMIGAQEADEMARVRREGIFRWCAQLVDDGRAVALDPDAVPRGAPLIAIGSIVEILTRYAQGTFIANPVELVPELMYGVVRPYLGEEAARRELTIPPPPDLVESQS
jgi:hypothetical protein